MIKTTNEKAGDGASGIRRFFTGTGLPLFLLAAIAVYESFLLAIVIIPADSTVWGSFAQEFKQWCFSYDPRTGGMEWASVVVMLIEPLFIGVIASFLWRSSLRELRTFKIWRERWQAAGAGGIVGVLIISSLFIYGKPSSLEGETLPFPGERIRVSLNPPAFRLADQKGNLFSLEEIEGRVVFVTGIYAACSTSCPDILRQTKALVDSLPPTMVDRVSVVALSLNPEYDTADLMNRVAEGYGFGYPQFRYINGEPGVMNELLQRFGFSRSVDAETGVVDHANLFLFIDVEGRIAYRLTLDERHSAWLRDAALALGEELEGLNVAQRF